MLQTLFLLALILYICAALVLAHRQYRRECREPADLLAWLAADEETRGYIVAILNTLE